MVDNNTMELRKNRLGIVPVDLDVMAREGLEKLHVFNQFRRLEVLHDYEYTCCGLCIKCHKYRIYDQQRQLQLSAIQDIQRFGSSDYTMGSKPPIVVTYLSQPILIIHFGAPKLFDFVSSCVAVTLPSEVLLGSITREEKTERNVLGESTIKLRVFDPTGQLSLETQQSGYTATGDNQHIVMMKETEIGRIGSTRGKSTLLFSNDLTFEVKAIMLAAAVWMEMLERKKPRWRQNK